MQRHGGVVGVLRKQVKFPQSSRVPESGVIAQYLVYEALSILRGLAHYRVPQPTSPGSDTTEVQGCRSWTVNLRLS